MAAEYQLSNGAEPEEPEALTDPSAAAFGDSPIELTTDQETALARQLKEIIDQYMGAMSERHRRYKELENAFNLVPDPKTAGQQPDSAQLITELTRTHCTTAHARLIEQLVGLTSPWVMIEPVHSERLSAQEQQQVKIETDTTTDFLHAYNRDKVNTDLYLDDATGLLTLLGNGIIRQGWEVRKRPLRYLDVDGQWHDETEDLSGIKLELIHPENFICWPLQVQKVKDGTVVGHRASLVESDFRATCAEFGVPDKIRDEILEKHKSRVEAAGDRIAAADVKQVQSPVPLIEVWELWCQRLPLPEKDYPDPTLDPPSYVVLMATEPSTVMRVLQHPYHCGRHGYFSFPYWRLPGTWLGDGVAGEVIFRQKSSDALQNLLIDHLKVAVHHLIAIKEASSVWEQRKELRPGGTIATENPQEDINVIPLGGDRVELIQTAQGREDIKAMEADQMTAVLQGRGDPTLKSGASPSSLQMLLNESGKRFGKIDRGIREELDEFFFFQLELIQQYAGSQLFYKLLPEEGANEMVRLKIMNRPSGKLSSKWKVSVRAPSAETNREVKQQQLVIFYNLTVQHLQLLMQVAQQVWGQSDPARLQRVAEESLVFLHAVYRQLKDYAQIGPIGAALPDIEPKPIDETLNNLLQQFQQLQQQLEQSQQREQQMTQMMMQAQGGQPGVPMEGMA